MIDFDKERHAVQQMQNNPNRNEAKFMKVRIILRLMCFMTIYPPKLGKRTNGEC